MVPSPNLILFLSLWTAILHSLSAGEAEVVPVRLKEEPTVYQWTSRDGLPANQVRAIAQDQNGYIWIGTAAGLARFDGRRFEKFTRSNEPAMIETSDYCDRIICPPDGSMWFSMANGLLRYRDGAFEAPDIEGVREKDAVFMAHARPAGLWLATNHQLVRVHQDRVVEQLPLKNVRRLYQPEDDVILVKTSRDTSRVRWITGSERNIGPVIRHGGDLTQDSAGAFWKFNKARQVAQLFNEEGTIEERPLRVIDRLPDERPNPELLRRLSSARHAVVRSSVLVIEEKEVLCFKGSGPWLRDINGNLWTGSFRSGLFYIRYPLLKTLLVERPGAPVKENHVWSVCEGEEGSIWWSDLHGVFQFKPESKEALRFTGVGKRTAVHYGGQGAIWTGFGRITDGSFHPWPEAVHSHLFMAYPLRDGSVLIGAEVGMFHLREGQVRRLTTKDGLAANRVLGFLSDSDGATWVGTGGGGGVSRYQDGQLTTYSLGDGIGAIVAVPALLDSDGAIWFASTGGLIRRKNDRFQTVRSEDGLYSDLVLSIQEDDFGWLWMNCHDGVFRVKKQQAIDFLDGRAGSVTSIAYTEADGMLSAEGNGAFLPSSCKLSDGRLLFPTIEGIAMIDPKKVHQLKKPRPRCTLLIVRADEEIIARDIHQSGGAALEAGRGRIMIFEFTAPEFGAPQRLGFQYRLRGQHDDWREDPGNRLVYYADLDPGEYAFEVMARSPQNLLSDRPTVFRFSIAPHFYQTAWFYALSGIGAVGLLAGAHRYRLRIQERILNAERRNALQSERTRISHDIHDDLGSRLSQISVLSEVAAQTLGKALNDRGSLERVANASKEALGVMDEIVWATNPANDSLSGLVSYLREFAPDFVNSFGVRCRLDLPSRLPHITLTAETRHHLFLTIKETLHNAVKHAQPTEVHLRLNITPDHLEFVVEDNGVGFPLPTDSTAPSAATPLPPTTTNGNGISTMTNRVNQLGGTLSVQSLLGHGTTVRVQIPVLDW